MCETCGCGAANLRLRRAPRLIQPGAGAAAPASALPGTSVSGGDLAGSPSAPRPDDPVAAGPRRVLSLEERVLAVNDEQAARNRAWLAARGVLAVNLISSPGAGKTRLLEATLDALAGEIGCAVITGDQQTDNDARRLRGRGAPVAQIETVSACHLDAAMVWQRLAEVVHDGVRLLLIENVGNLVCPASFDLGEAYVIALLSTTEGEDKPIKYPVLFDRAGLVLLTKIDLAPHLQWERERCLAYIRQVQPAAPVLELSAQTGQGMQAWLGWLRQALAASSAGTEAV